MYGFTTVADQDFFRMLQTVQGIGPKAALSILSTLTINELILSISSGDKAMISRAEGVGPKVAARVTSELSEKVSNMQLILGKKDISNTYKESNTNSLKYNFTNVEEQFLDVVEDSISALVNLGYTRSEVFSVVMNIKRDFNLKKVSIDFTVNSVIPLALKELSKVVK